MSFPATFSREQIIRENYAAFAAVLPSILIKHAGKVALLHNREIVGYFDDPSEAIVNGRQQFPARDFSLQTVETQAVDLGWHSRV